MVLPESFEKRKQDVLLRKDKSRKGSIDEPIKMLVSTLNAMPHFYTTSSCSGRMGIVSIAKGFRKNKTRWLFVSHRKVRFKEFEKALAGLLMPNKPNHKHLIFKYEPFIMHIVARSLKDAQAVVDAARASGFKKSGIQSTRKRFVVEVASSDYIDAPIVQKGKLLVPPQYLKILINEANKKLLRTHRKIKFFEKILSSYFKDEGK